MQSNTQTYFEGNWHEGNIKLFGAEEYSSWLGMSVFDGLRSFDNLLPDGEFHCKRSIRSANALEMYPTVDWKEVYDLVVEGIHRYEQGAHLYIRIEFWDQLSYATQTGGIGFAIVIERLEFIRPHFTAHLSTYRRCGPTQAPTEAKASCLYPMGILAAKKANIAGFDDAVMLGPDGLVAEFTMSNIFIVKNGSIITPSPNGTFLNGITRQRFLKLFTKDGFHVEERDIYPAELEHADEIFATGNAHKIYPIVKYLDRELGEGPICKRGWELYLEYAQQFKI